MFYTNYLHQNRCFVEVKTLANGSFCRLKIVYHHDFDFRNWKKPKAIFSKIFFFKILTKIRRDVIY